MYINDLLKGSFLKRLYASYSVPHFVGPPGIGKTSIVEQFCADQELGYVPFHLTSVDAPDVRGFTYPTKSEGGPVTLFTKSPLLTLVERTGLDSGIIFLDEFGQCEHATAKAVAPMLSERRLGNEEVPEGWRVWLASNRQQDRAGVLRMLSHNQNRVMEIPLESDQESWVTWATAHGLHPLFISFARHRPGIIFTNEVPEKPGPYCTPRSYVRAEEFLTVGMKNKLHGDLPLDPVSSEAVGGLISAAVAAELFAHFAVKELLPEADEIVSAPKRAKVPPESRLDAQYAAMQLALYIVNRKNTDAVATYLMRLNRELQTSAIVQLIRKLGGAMLNAPSLAAWASDPANHALVAESLNVS